jgi:GT2 family glycosyltransferase
MIQCSLIIPVFNGCRFLNLFWSSLNIAIKFSVEIIIIDDASTENIHSTLSSISDKFNIRYYRNEFNQGYAASVNKGMSLANGELMILLNSDLILTENTLVGLIKPFNNDRNIGLVGSKLLYPQTNKIQHFGVAFSHTRKFHVYTHASVSDKVVSGNKEVQAVTFALVCLPKKVYDIVGQLNTLYYNGCEDIDYSLRVKNSGYKVIVSSEALAYHWESQSGNARHISSPDNEARFWKDWGNKLKVDYLKYYDESFTYYFQDNPVPDNPTIINLSANYQVEEIISSIKEKLGCKSAVVNFRIRSNHTYHLLLPMIIPLEYMRYNSPIVYLVDEFPQMSQNFYWFAQRAQFQKGDIIIDNYGNVINSGNYADSIAASRIKSKEDVS